MKLLSSQVFQNSTDTPSKRSTVERRLDRVVMFMFVILFFMCAFTGVMHACWTATRGKGMWYAMIKEQPHREFDADRPVLVFIFSFLNGIVLYGYLIPISLYVSVEIAKATQALYFINFDADMHHRSSATWAQARTSNLNEELGNVQIIMSDKTGTLTQNVSNKSDPVYFTDCLINSWTVSLFH
jgi:phospholipid-transporting ATPase